MRLPFREKIIYMSKSESPANDLSIKTKIINQKLYMPEPDVNKLSFLNLSFVLVSWARLPRPLILVLV